MWPWLIAQVRNGRMVWRWWTPWVSQKASMSAWVVPAGSRPRSASQARPVEFGRERSEQSALAYVRGPVRITTGS